MYTHATEVTDLVTNFGRPNRLLHPILLSLIPLGFQCVTSVASADPIVLRGGVDRSVMNGAAVQAQESMPPTAPGFNGAVPAAAAVAGTGAAAAYYAHHHGGPHYQSQQGRYDYSGERPYTAVRTEKRTYFQQHPKVKAALIGAGVGTAAGAVTGLVTHRGVFRGAAIGAGTGAGVGLIRSSETLSRHPIVKDLATGAATGLGLGWASSGHHHHNVGKGAAVGAALGLGFGVLKNGLH